MIAVRIALAGAVAMLAGCQSAGLDLSALMSQQQFGYGAEELDVSATQQVAPGPALLPDNPPPPEAQAPEAGPSSSGGEYLAVGATLGLTPAQMDRMTSRRSADGRILLPDIPNAPVVDLSDVRAAMMALPSASALPASSADAPETLERPVDPQQ